MSQIISREEIQATFQQYFDAGLVARYKKYQQVDARQATPGELIVTLIAGKLETQQTATNGQVVVMNLATKSREQQLLNADKFQSRYEEIDKPLSEDWTRFNPIGLVDATVWTGDDTEFNAPWGEPMVIGKGDFLCRVPETYDDVYRIARSEFLHTYAPEQYI